MDLLTQASGNIGVGIGKTLVLALQAAQLAQQLLVTQLFGAVGELQRFDRRQRTATERQHQSQRSQDGVHGWRSSSGITLVSISSTDSAPMCL